MKNPIDAAAINQLFLAARTAVRFVDRPVDDVTIHRLYNIYKWGPTSMNCQPGRVIFARNADAKAQLRSALSPGNVEKTLAAPVTAIVAYDTEFFEHLPTQFPANPNAREMFASNRELAAETAFRNGSLQGAYLILAARALGLGAGPMSGFSQDAVNTAFFGDGRWKANFLVNLGWVDTTAGRPRGPRLSFEDTSRIL